jgi:tetratricopeptide (TPR) repeat protein
VSATASGGKRYRYLSPGVSATGDRAAAMDAFAEGARAQQGDRLSAAIQSYRRAAQLDPAYYEAHHNLGLAAAEAGDLPQALSAYESALALKPDSADARYNFALVLKQANYVTDAANELEKLLALHPREARAHLALGNLCDQQLRQPDRAREHYVKVLELDPQNTQAPAIRYWLATRRP